MRNKLLKNEYSDVKISFKNISSINKNDKCPDWCWKGLRNCELICGTKTELFSGLWTLFYCSNAKFCNKEGLLWS